MFLTEKEAAEKWCPWARGLIFNNSEPVPTATRLPGIGGGPDPNMEWPSPNCLGARCMAWQWHDGTVGEARRGWCSLMEDR